MRSPDLFGQLFVGNGKENGATVRVKERKGIEQPFRAESFRQWKKNCKMQPSRLEFYRGPTLGKEFETGLRAKQ